MAATKWNPSNPSVAGCEWPGANFNTVVPTSTVAYGCTVVSTATETIDTIDTLILPPGGTNPPLLQMDVYDLANPVYDNGLLVLAKPVDNYYNGPSWQQWNSGTFSPYSALAYTYVDDIISLGDSLGIGSADAVIYNGVNPSSPSQIMFNAGNAAFYSGQTGGGSAVLAGQRIEYVEIISILANETALPILVEGYLQIAGGITLASDSGPTIVPPNSGYWRAQFSFYVNTFAGGLPWSQSDATGLTTGGFGFGIGITTKNAVGNVAVNAMMLQFHTRPERRLATAFAFGSPVGPTWASGALVSPATYGTATWSKVSGHRYLICCAPIVNHGVPTLTFINSVNVAGGAGDLLTGTNFSQVPLTPGLVPGAPQVEDPGQFPLIMQHSGAASVDSNAYVAATTIQIGAASTTATQGVSTESAQAYGTITVLVGTTPNGQGGALQNQPIAVSLHKTSDNSLLLGPVNINPTDVPADGNYHLVSLQAGSTTLTAAEPVYINCTSTSAVPWNLPILTSYYPGMALTEAHVLLAQAIGIGGSADTADGTAAADFPWSIGIIPATPSGFAATIGTKSLTAAPPGGPSTIHYSHLTWTATSLGGTFGFYELQRQDNGVWNDIAIITTEANALFNDVEALRGVAQGYRLRVERNDGSLSAWTSTVTVTVPTALNCDLILASNWDPTRSLAYQENGDGSPTHSFARANAQSTVVHLIAGRQMPVAFRPLIEGDSDVFQRTLLVSMDTAGNPVANAAMDRAAFDALLALIEDVTVPYIALLDGHGRRWYTFPEFIDGTYVWTGHEHNADVKFTEVVAAPSPPTFALAPTP